MKAAVWSVALWSVCVAGMARAQDKAEQAQAVEAKTAAQLQAQANEATPAAADAPKQADEAKSQSAGSQSSATAEQTGQPGESPQPAEAPKSAEAPKGSETSGAVDSDTEKPSEPVRAATVEKPAPAKASSPVAFQTAWVDASADEKALFLEAFGESSKSLQERWDKATPEERRKIFRAHPLLSARPLKHRWASATPEERAAFLEATPRIVGKVREAWDSASPEQRKMLALEHPYFARKAFHHGWMETTPQEKIAFLSAHPALHAELKARWTGASAAQKQWYARNYPGIDSLASGGHWGDASTEERALFLQANPAISEKVRDAWQKTQPEMRAAMVRKWQGWPLRAYQAKLENAGGKTMVASKARPAPTGKATASAKPTAAVKPTAKTARK